jgi:hypothetical protein
MRSGLGNGENGQFTFFDTINLLSFYISMLNLNENMTQNDKQELFQELEKKTGLLLNEIHGHLQEQDKKIDMILEELKNDNR